MAFHRIGLWSGGGAVERFHIRRATGRAAAGLQSGGQSLCQRHLRGGHIESLQAQGENINIYPEVTGPIVQVLVAEGARVHKGYALLGNDDSVQRATTE